MCSCIALERRSNEHNSGRSNPPLIGFARLITDDVSFAYLTDVYVLKEHQGKGLGSWLIECVRETLDAWPALRRTMLLVNDERSVGFYRDKMGMELVEQGKGGLKVMGKKGKGSPLEA
jgi:GNAT superfamily N-acetyltransferase